ncbi:helix-turn-helix transcriptional regulator [Algoriphagus sp. C2-6-M1]|uniref:helix-turn-helix domain-containing protein n=1 Tax=Algoriphagus persicinus TaxID=3108754 RepID=UPI002B3E7824|nr:helix-turn-helix transcriptional regulator [Algoriphagus sp. C2-6-M1]MEB2779943.1 helix-turn-helix transcriptional regulator [Algoriphagus sp. C2-6-M1]
MKQPELGKKIYESRKAKGLTQEELVEKCNLNVRTIQRIEAGDVTPRSHTIKTLFEALEIDFEVEEIKYSQNYNQTQEKELGIKFSPIVLFAGSLYLILTLIEIPLDIKYIADSISGGIYIPFKIGIFVCYFIFMWPFLKIGQFYGNNVISMSVFFLLIARLIAYSYSMIVILDDNLQHEIFYMIPSIIFWGMGYVLLGYNLSKLRIIESFGLKPIGILGMVSGFLILSFIGQILAPFTIYIFEIGLLYFLNRYSKNTLKVSSTNPNLSTEAQF